MENNETQPLVTPAAAPAAESTPSFLRRHAVAVAVIAAALAVIVVAGGTAWGVSAAVASTQTTVDPASADTTMHSAGPHTAKAGKRKAAHGVRGTLTAVNGDTWTLRTSAGKTVTVKLTSTTAFGTKKTPAERSSFVSGDRVGVLGERSGEAITAARVVHLVHAAHTPTPSASPAPSA